MNYSFFDKDTTSFVRELPPVPRRSFATTTCNPYDLGCNIWAGLTGIGDALTPKPLPIANAPTTNKKPILSASGSASAGLTPSATVNASPIGYSGGKSGSGNTYQGLKDAGFDVTKTDPKTGVTVLNNKNGDRINTSSCQPFDITCLMKGLHLPNIIPGIPSEYLLLGGVGIVILYLVIR